MEDQQHAHIIQPTMCPCSHRFGDGGGEGVCLDGILNNLQAVGNIKGTGFFLVKALDCSGKIKHREDFWLGFYVVGDQHAYTKAKQKGQFLPPSRCTTATRIRPYDAVGDLQRTSDVRFTRVLKDPFSLRTEGWILSSRAAISRLICVWTWPSAPLFWRRRLNSSYQTHAIRKKKQRGECNS